MRNEDFTEALAEVASDAPYLYLKFCCRYSEFHQVSTEYPEFARGAAI